MRRLLLLIGLLVFIAGCDGRFQKRVFGSSVCRDFVGASDLIDVGGYTLTAIHYGDSRLIVIPISEIKKNSEFRFRLLPKLRKTDGGVAYKNVTVSISSQDDDSDPQPDWLDVSGSFSADKGVLVACVPPDITQDVYKYKVTVTDGGDELGMLDPRADVVD